MELQLINIVRTPFEEERVVIKVLKKCNLNRYILFDTTYDENGVFSNKHRHLYVLPNIDELKDGDFIWVYTKSGVFGSHKNTSNTTTYKLYWGLNCSIWNNIGDAAYLIHYDDWEKLAVKD